MTNTTTDVPTKSAPNPMLRVLAIRDFMLLWVGGSTSMLGSQFSLIALPWLVLQITGDPLQLGIVLALGGIPRAAFMLFGGAIADRFSPRMILLLCDWINFGISVLVAVLVFTGQMQVWMLYVFSLVTGLLSGFVMPAASSITPSLVPADDLQAANSLSMGTQQLVGFLGPALAGIIIGKDSSILGMTIAFAVDGLTFGFSALALGLMRGGNGQPAKTDEAGESIWRSIREAFAYLWTNAGLKYLFTIMATINFLFTGPLLVGIPVLAEQRLPEGATAFGFLMSAYAGGNLVGLILAGVLPKAKGRSFSILMIGLLASFGAVLISFGWITNTWVDVTLMILLGVGNGYFGLVLFTWIQQRTPREMIGRVMSMVMLAGMGLVPFSQGISGAISRWDLTLLFALSGGLILVLTLWAALQPALHSLSNEMVGE